MIREVKYSDIDDITQIYNHYICNTEISFEESAISSTDMNIRVAKVKEADLPWLVFERSSRVVGYAYAAKWHERSAYRKTAEITIYLHPAYLGKGIGSKLYSQLFERLRAVGIHSAIGRIALPNIGSVALHEKFGMKKVGHLESLGCFHFLCCLGLLMQGCGRLSVKRLYGVRLAPCV